MLAEPRREKLQPELTSRSEESASEGSGKTGDGLTTRDVRVSSPSTPSGVKESLLDITRSQRDLNGLRDWDRLGREAWSRLNHHEIGEKRAYLDRQRKRLTRREETRLETIESQVKISLSHNYRCKRCGHSIETGQEYKGGRAGRYHVDCFDWILHERDCVLCKTRIGHEVKVAPSSVAEV